MRILGRQGDLLLDEQWRIWRIVGKYPSGADALVEGGPGEMKQYLLAKFEAEKAEAAKRNR